MSLRAPLVLAVAATLVACDEPTPTSSPATSAPSAATSSAAASSTPPAAASAAQLSEGDPAPAVKLTLHDGTSVDLASMKDELVFVYFYPKDDTPGCTVEAKGLRDNYEALTEAGVKVFGVSMQDATSHQAFIDKHELPFSLVVDDGTVAKAFDVPVSGEFAARHSFLLKGGEVLKTWRKVIPSEHAAEVLEAAKAAAS